MNELYAMARRFQRDHYRQASISMVADGVEAVALAMSDFAHGESESARLELQRATACLKAAAGYRILSLLA